RIPGAARTGHEGTTRVTPRQTRAHAAPAEAGRFVVSAGDGRTSGSVSSARARVSKTFVDASWLTIGPRRAVVKLSGGRGEADRRATAGGRDTRRRRRARRG